jgi:hypothetical protein
MTAKDYELIAEGVWRSGYIKDGNKIRQEARERMRRLIACDLASNFANKDREFDKEKFLKDCGIYII